MVLPGSAVLWAVLLAAGTLGRRVQKPAGPTSLITTVQPKAGFDAQRFAGTWLLAAVGSACRSLQEQGHRVEATALQVAPQGAALAVSTFRKLNGICWQVRQHYGDTRVLGRFLLRGRGPRGPVHVVVAETDYQSFAVLYQERGRTLSVKLYVRSFPVSDSALDEFERRVAEASLTQDDIIFFPTYGFCEAADQFHVLDEVRR